MESKAESRHFIERMHTKTVAQKIALAREETRGASLWDFLLTLEKAQNLRPKDGCIIPNVTIR
jgi:hypothetical protein